MMIENNYDKEDYVSSEFAKFLMDKGYPVEIIGIRGDENFECSYIAPTADCIGWANNTGIKHPTYSSIQRWFRKNYGLEIYPYSTASGYHWGICKDYAYWAEIDGCTGGTSIADSNYDSWETYNEALDNAIKYAFTIVESGKYNYKG